VRAEVELRREVAGSGTSWLRGEVDEGWLERGWVVVLTDVERHVEAGAGSWARQGRDDLWLPVTSVARLLVRPPAGAGG
jgi:hypothetical protein